MTARRTVLTAFFTLAIAAPTAADPSPEDMAPAAERLHGFLARRTEAHAFSGAVLVTRGDTVVLDRGYGLADFEHGVAHRAETKYRIGSLTKSFVAAAVLLLEAEEKLDVEHSICTFLEPCPEAWGPVTLHHLLTHTSGIPDLFGDVDEAPVEDTRREIEKAIAGAEDTSLRAEPGSRYRYSNFGYMLLGYAVEKASGRYLEEVLQARIFGPLGMADTRYDRVWQIVGHRASGYRERDGRLQHVEYDDPAAYAAGGLLSSVRDMGRWARAVMGERLLPEAARDRMLTPGLGDYGYGWLVRERFDRPMIWHNGGIGGFSSDLAIYPREKAIVIVLSNVQNANATGVGCGLAAVLFDRRHPLVDGGQAIPVAPAKLATYAGTYLTEADEERTVTFEDGELRYRGSMALKPIADDMFQMRRREDIVVAFARGADGVVDRMTVESCGLVEIRARRAATGS